MIQKKTQQKYGSLRPSCFFIIIKLRTEIANEYYRQKPEACTRVVAAAAAVAAAAVVVEAVAIAVAVEVVH